MTLRQKAIIGVKWSTLSTVFTALLQIFQLAVLTRLLNPNEFGLITIVSIFIGFAQAFLDMGISNAIIHKQDITQNQLSTLYWVNVIAGCILFVIISILAPVIAIFYENSQLKFLTIILAVTFLIQPFGQQFMVLWQKELRFDEIAKINIISKIVSTSVSIYLAFVGYGAFALVYGSLAGTSIQTLQLIRKGLKENPIAFVFCLKEVKEFLNFGFYQMAEKTLNYFNGKIDELLVGRLLGLEVLGLYTVAKQLALKPIQIINPIISRVTFPLLAKIQHDVDRLRKIYLQTIAILSSINFPLYTFLIVMGQEVVLLLYGAQWSNAIPIVQILACYGAVRSTMNPVGSLLLAKGKANWGFYWNLGLFIIVPLCIYFISQNGVEALSWGLVAIMASLVIPMWYFLIRNLCQVTLYNYMKQFFVPFSVCISVGLLTYHLKSVLDIENLVVNIVVVGFVGLVSITALYFIFRRSFLATLMDLSK